MPLPPCVGRSLTRQEESREVRGRCYQRCAGGGKARRIWSIGAFAYGKRLGGEKGQVRIRDHCGWILLTRNEPINGMEPGEI